MRPLQTKNDLIKFAENNLLERYTAIHRAFHGGTVENLGGFRYLYHDLSGWILKLISKYKAEYYVAIIVDHLYYRIGVLNNVSWKYWEGDKSNNKLYQGDNPEEYKLLRDKELGNDSKTRELN